MSLTEAKIREHINLIRQGAAVFLFDTATLLHRINVVYESGEAKPVYANPVIFKCRLITRSGSESKNIAAQAREISQVSFNELYRMQIPYDLEVDLADIILYTDKVSGNVKRFEVVHSPAKHEYTGAVVIFLQEQH